MLDLYQPIAPRIRVVVIMVIIMIMPLARDAAALSGALQSVGAKRFIMGSQKCTGELLRSTHKARKVGDSMRS